MMLSIIFVLIEILLFLFILHIKFSERSISCIVKVTLSVILIMGWHAFIAAIYGLISIPISLITIGSGDVILLIMTGVADYKYGIQKICNKKEILIIICIIWASLMFGYKFYGKGLQIHFWSVDGAAHCEMALTIATKHILGTNLYFSALNNGLAMMICKPFIGEDYLYKVFVAMQMFDFTLTGLSFYSLISQFSANDKIFLKTAFTFLYIVGYPLYSIIFGFPYFEMSVTLITCISLLVQMYYNDILNRNVFYITCSILLFSLFVCYTYFVPVVFISVFLLLFFKSYVEQDKHVCLDIIKEQIFVFLIPCILGMLYSYNNVKELGTGGGITNEGGCYFDLYSNFIPILLLILLGIYYCKKNNKEQIIFLLGFTSFIFFFFLLYLHANGRVSLYYLSKIYNLFWLCAFVFAYEGVVSLQDNYKDIFKISITGCILFACICVTNRSQSFMNDSLHSKRKAIDYVSDIYRFNYSSSECAYESDEKIKDYQIIRNRFAKDGLQSILSVGNEMDCAWFKAITDQNNRESYDSEKLKNTISLKTIKYAYCIDSDFTNQNIDYISSLGELVYSSEIGKLYKIE